MCHAFGISGRCGKAGGAVYVAPPYLYPGEDADQPGAGKRGRISGGVFKGEDGCGEDGWEKLCPSVLF